MDQIDIIRKQLYDAKFTNELAYLTDPTRLEEDDKDYIDARIAYLQKHIDINNKPPEKTDFEVAIDELTKFAKSKPWFQLPEQYKMAKIKEYFDSSQINDELKTKILKDFTTRIYDKQLRTKNDVTYDKEIGKIIEITAFKYNKNDNTYTITPHS